MLTIYKDHAGEFRWRIKASNGQNIGPSEEGFTRYSSARNAIRKRYNGAHKCPNKWQRGAKSWAGGKFSY